jgi:hypothetical protein
MIVIAPAGHKPPEQESQHWYFRDGRPCYEVEKKAGGLRPTTLTDARKLGLVPSVTTVLSVLAKPALTTWKVQQGILAALTLPRREDEPESDWLDRIMEDSGQQAKSAAEEGTRIHDACECSFKGRPVEDRYQPHVAAVHAKLTELFPTVSDWVAEASFASLLGYGGKVDLHSPSTGIVVDFKGKDGDFSDGKKLAYDQHYQLAAYQRGLNLPVNACANLFVSRTHPGKVAAHVWSESDIAKGWTVFAATCDVWRALKGYDARFELAVAA